MWRRNSQDRSDADKTKKNKIQIRINEKYKNTNKKNKYSQFNLKLVATSKIRDFSILLFTRILFDNIQRKFVQHLN